MAKVKKKNCLHKLHRLVLEPGTKQFVRKKCRLVTSVAGKALTDG